MERFHCLAHRSFGLDYLGHWCPWHPWHGPGFTEACDIVRLLPTEHAMLYEKPCEECDGTGNNCGEVEGRCHPCPAAGCRDGYAISAPTVDFPDRYGGSHVRSDDLRWSQGWFDAGQYAVVALPEEREDA